VKVKQNTRQFLNKDSRQEMMTDQTARKAVYSIRCPIHPNVEIGEWSADIKGFDHLGGFCYKCKRMMRYNQQNFSNKLIRGYFPEKTI